MKYHILFNEKAGNNGCSEKIKELKAAYGEENVELHDVTEDFDYRPIINGLSESDVFVILGGDGTINHFVNNTDGIPFDNDVLYFATGTGNDFLNDVNEANIEKPFSIKKYITDLPTVEIKGKTYRFLNGVGFGIDGYCCEIGDKIKLEKPGKKVNYTAIAVKGLLFDYKPVGADVVVDGKKYRYEKVWIAPTMHGKYYGGGMMAAPEQDRLGDGKCSLVLFHGSGKLKTLMVFPSIFKGEHIKHSEMVALHEGREITVTFDAPRPLQIDGETFLDVVSYTVKSGK